MNTYLKKALKFFVVPNEIADITTLILSDFDNNNLKFELDTNSKFKENDELEFFTNINEGILYFKAKINNISDNIAEINIPKEYDILQRRENKRVLVNIPIHIIENNEKFIPALLIDLSVGGIKIRTQNQLDINKKYDVILDIDKLHLKFSFTPTRLSFEDEMFESSGKIDIETPSEKIELVQYCYKKIFEQTNR